tara:strand:- start:341 stop:523 length:183 start_codon:yes stop_codon:yes gene_type:complete
LEQQVPQQVLLQQPVVLQQPHQVLQVPLLVLQQPHQVLQVPQVVRRVHLAQVEQTVQQVQ